MLTFQNLEFQNFDAFSVSNHPKIFQRAHTYQILKYYQHNIYDEVCFTLNLQVSPAMLLKPDSLQICSYKFSKTFSTAILKNTTGDYTLNIYFYFSLNAIYQKFRNCVQRFLKYLLIVLTVVALQAKLLPLFFRTFSFLISDALNEKP